VTTSNPVSQTTISCRSAGPLRGAGPLAQCHKPPAKDGPDSHCAELTRLELLKDAFRYFSKSYLL